MRSMWNGSISFGLVTIPVALYPATSREELTFRLLRKTDHSPVNYKRVAQADGKEVPWENIVKGYEYEKGKFVILKEEDFKRVDLEAAAQTIDIMDFVEAEEINPMYFQKPYYIEPQKGGEKAYALLRDALRDTGWKRPPTPPLSSRIKLNEKVKKVSSRYPWRSRNIRWFSRKDVSPRS